MILKKCDICKKIKNDCVEKDVNHRTYDFCNKCWDEIFGRIGKGRSTNYYYYQSTMYYLDPWDWITSIEDSTNAVVLDYFS